MNDKEEWFTGDSLKMGIKCSSALWLAVPPISYNNTLYTDGGATQLFAVDYIADHELNTSFEGLYIFIDCDTRVRTQQNTVPSDGLTLLNYIHGGAGIRLANLEFQMLKEKLQNQLITIRPDKNILSHALEIDPDKIKQTINMGVEKGKEFLNKYNK